MKHHLLITALTCASIINAQKNYLPSNAIVMSNAVSDQGSIVMGDQSGRVPYKGGHDCGGNGSSEVTPEGNTVTTIDHAQININIQHYTEDSRNTFDNIMKYTPPSEELKTNAQQSQPGDGAKRTVITKDMPGGKLSIFVDKYSNCIETPYKEYTSITFYGYIIDGLTIVKTYGSYYSADPTLAEKMHSEVGLKLKKVGF
jgi:hypothetical protein